MSATMSYILIRHQLDYWRLRQTRTRWFCQLRGVSFAVKTLQSTWHALRICGRRCQVTSAVCPVPHLPRLRDADSSSAGFDYRVARWSSCGRKPQTISPKVWFVDGQAVRQITVTPSWCRFYFWLPVQNDEQFVKVIYEQLNIHALAGRYLSRDTPHTKTTAVTLAKPCAHGIGYRYRTSSEGDWSIVEL